MLQKSPQTSKSKPRRRVASFVGWLVLVTVGVHLIRTFMVEGYYIPSSSMEPTFMGDPSSGDRVVVDKTTFSRHDPERWEIAVFRRPGEEGTFVKRIVGLPGDRVLIRNGDVYNHGALVAKPVELLDDLLIPVFDAREHGAQLSRFWRSRGGVSTGDDASIRIVPDGDGVAELTTADDVTDGYWRDGAWSGGCNPVGDLAIAVDVEPGDGVRSLELALTEDGGRVSVRATADAAAELWVSGRLAASIDDLRLRTGERRRIELTNVDDQVVLRVDGSVVATAAFPTGSRGAARGLRRSNGARVRWRGGAATLHDLRLRRDLHYTIAGLVGVASPCPVGEGEYFVLGDNSRNSCDSRDWGCVHRASLIGAPLLIVWPSTRLRLF